MPNMIRLDGSGTTVIPASDNAWIAEASNVYDDTLMLDGRLWL